MTEILWQDMYKGADKAAFWEKVKEVCSRLGIRPDWLATVMKIESGINPKAVNPTSGATGLIQFMPATAAGLGTSTAALRMMSGTRQLDYVERYLNPYKGRIKSFYDLYLAVFYPAFIGKPDNTVFPDNVIAWNKPLFKYGKTVGAWKRYVKEWSTGGNKVVERRLFGPFLEDILIVAGVVALLVCVALFLF